MQFDLLLIGRDQIGISFDLFKAPSNHRLECLVMGAKDKITRSAGTAGDCDRNNIPVSYLVILQGEICPNAGVALGGGQAILHTGDCCRS